jgi:hypothetical protein
MKAKFISKNGVQLIGLALLLLGILLGAVAVIDAAPILVIETGHGSARLIGVTTSSVVGGAGHSARSAR